jgi:hypothetical protein
MKHILSLLLIFCFISITKAQQPPTQADIDLVKTHPKLKDVKDEQIQRVISNSFVKNNIVKIIGLGMVRGFKESSTFIFIPTKNKLVSQNYNYTLNATVAPPNKEIGIDCNILYSTDIASMYMRMFFDPFDANSKIDGIVIVMLKDVEPEKSLIGAKPNFMYKEVDINYIKSVDFDGVCIQTSDGKTIQLKGEQPTVKDLSIYQGMPRKVVDDFPYFSGIDYVRLSSIQKVIFKGSTVSENSPKMYVMDKLRKTEGYSYHKYYSLDFKGGAAGNTIFSRAYANDLKSYYSFSFPQKTISATHAEWYIDRKEDWEWKKDRIYALDYGGKWYFFMIGDGEADFTSWYHDTLTK